MTDVENNDDHLIELPVDKESGNLLVKTLQASFDGACGLKYRNPKTNAFRAISLVDEV